MKKLSFSNITLNTLRQVVPLKQIVDDSRFDTWFGYQPPLDKDEKDLLQNLLNKHRPYFSSYSEEELKAKFIIPILNKVDFMVGDVKDWYERPLRAILNDYEIGGYTDYMVAKGEDEPELPYFFLQEFKPSVANIPPENQLLAELIVAAHLNDETEMKGGTVQGQYWKFMIAEKKETQWLYYTSQVFDAANFNDLCGIYNCLRFIKNSIIQ
jgi:hypothetical protein